MDTQRHKSPFAWIRQRRSQLRVDITAPTDTAIHERMLQPDRTAAAAAMMTNIASVLDTAFGEVYAADPGNRVHLLRTGTGTGKTSRVMGYIASDPRTYAWDGLEDSPDYPGPIVFLLPTYTNIAEVRGRAEELALDAGMDDKALAAAARARGLVHQKDIAGYVAKLAHPKLRMEIYRGKRAAGCRRDEEMQLIIEAGLPTSNLCRSRATDAGRNVERFCQFYDTCDAILQKERVKKAHVVFAPRSFIDLRMPEELDRVRAVIGDEAVWSLLVYSARFPLAALDLERQPPRLSPDNEMTAEGMLGQRSLAAPVVKSALVAGVDPASALRDHVVEVPGIGQLTGLLQHSARHAARVTSAAVVDRGRINPWMKADAIRDLCARPTGAHIRAESRFWDLVAEGLGTGRSDPRIQLVERDTDNPQIRLSWLSSANWQTVPWLLLDASGDPEITARVFPGREIVVHDLPVSMNMVTMACIDQRFALRTIVPGRDATPAQKFAAAKIIAEIRGVISAICGVHANGRVLIGMPKKIRKVVQKRWAEPLNCDFLHSGAEAGLDFARQHVAVVSIGRLELPVGEIDSQVAALTAADPIPELPIDLYGNGHDEDGVALYPNTTMRTLHLRDGSDVHFEAQEHCGPMAQRVQRQHREERIRQLVGRLRAFYRADTVSCYVIGQAIPEDLIIDEICAWDDLVGSGAAMWDIVRMAGGMLSAPVMTHVCPEGGTVQRYQGWIDRLPECVTRHYHGLFAAFDIRGGWRDVGLPGHVTDFEAYFSAIPEARGDAQFDDMVKCVTTFPAAEARPVDAIELHLGDRATRLSAERAAIAKVRDLVQRRGEWKPAGLKYRGGQGELQMQKAALGVWAAMENIDDPWIYSDVEAPVAAATKIEVKVA